MALVSQARFQSFQHIANLRALRSRSLSRCLTTSRRPCESRGAAGNRYLTADLNAARWLRYDDPAAVALWATVQARDPGAVTYKDLIIAGPSLLAQQNGCSRALPVGDMSLSMLRNIAVSGFNEFVDRYLRESPKGMLHHYV